jgi:hypothetical protein
VIITGLLRPQPIIILIVVGLQLAAVVVLAWAQLCRQRTGLAGALRLVNAMGVVADISVGSNGELQVRPVSDDVALEQNKAATANVRDSEVTQGRPSQRPGVVATFASLNRVFAWRLSMLRLGSGKWRL